MSIDLSRLDTLTTDELRALWAANMGRSKPPHSRRLLVRELAWRTQERVHGGFDVQTRRLLQAAMRAATSTSSKGDADSEVAPRVPKPRRKAKRIPKLPASTRIVREWRGRRYEVMVSDDGRAFLYRDRTYTSLTVIAREITGTHQSGPRFFGLTNRAAPSSPRGRQEDGR